MGVGMNQISLFDGTLPLKIDKPLRLIECFAGYGSQALSLKYLGAEFEHWKIAEWAVKSIQAYKDMHFPNDNTDYSAEHNKEWLIDYLYEKGISADYNKPMKREQIARMGEDKIRTVYNNIIATHNLVSVTNVKGKDLEITDTDKYTYILTYSFPCQDLSSAGLTKGMAKGSGTRSGLLWEIERMLDECDELPQVLLMENVPEVIGAKNSKSFSDWFMKLESLGYKSWYKVINAKDYEMPQNRERCFMVSALGDHYYDFPNPKPLKLRLKDLLEDKVDEKYYISDKALNGILNSNFAQQSLENRTEKNGIMGTILSRDYKDPKLVIEPKCEQVAQLEGGSYNEMTGRVYSSSGLSPTVRTFCGGGQEVKILEPHAIGIEVVGNYHESCHDASRIVSGKGIAPTVKENHGTITAVLEENDVIVWDGYNQQVRVDQSCVGTLTRNCGGDLKRNGQGIIEPSDCRIRKLTPKECFRLMGVKDEDFERVAKNQSNSSLYHLAGDSIVTNCLMAIFKEMGIEKCQE